MSTVPLAVRQSTDRIYYGWVLVAVLVVTETTSYGILSYAFPVFLAPMQAELGWSRLALTGAFSVAMLIAGLVAIPAGHWVDRHGARALMTAGSVLAALLLVAWSFVDSLWSFYLVWAGIGFASAAVLYEPAFAVLATWFVRLRSRALTILTFGAGFASVLFVPLATWLVAQHGWRDAALYLGLIYAALTIVPHALLLRRRPEDLGLIPDGEAAAASFRGNMPRVTSVARRTAVRSRSFVLLSIAFGLSSLVTTGMMVHLIPLLLERGYDASFAGVVIAAIGTLALPGRIVFTPLGSRWPRPAVTATIFGLQLLGIATLLSTNGVFGVWLFVALFGAGFGAITPARAALIAEFYGPAEFGAISGTLALTLACARAMAPVGASVLYSVAGGYASVLWVFLAFSAASTLAVYLADERALAPALMTHVNEPG